MLIVGIVLGLGAMGAAVWFGFLRDPNNQPDWLDKLLNKDSPSTEEKKRLMGIDYKRRVRREFNDTI